MKNVVIGLHKDPWHDAGAAVVALDNQGQRVIATIAQERLDRNKNSRQFPNSAVVACLKEVGLSSPFEADFVFFDYIYDSQNWWNDFRRNPCRKDVFLSDFIPNKLQPIRHHLCHAASCFFSSPFSEAAILVVDGRGTKWETQTLWLGRGNSIDLLEESYCVGIGLIYEAMTQALGFGFLEAGKTMGLAPFGKQWPGPILNVPGKFEGLNTDYGQYCNADNQLLISLPNLSSQEAWERCAYDIQLECERALTYLATYTKQKTGATNLCLSGGVALNSVANQKIFNSGLFENIFINPACSDSGIALGAALYGFHHHLQVPRDFREISPFMGPTYSKERIKMAVKSWQGEPITRNVEMACVDLLSANKVVALFEGRSEMGPRALGNRSILMSPSSKENRDYLNDVIKRREPFRPFAPCVPLEHASTYFEFHGQSPYMLLVVPVRKQWQSQLAAITHVDGTARIQTVAKTFHPRLHHILCSFGKSTGVPVLLNTSFNIAGEPLVETPEEAIVCFSKSGIDALLIDEYLLVR